MHKHTMYSMVCSFKWRFQFGGTFIGRGEESLLFFLALTRSSLLWYQATQAVRLNGSCVAYLGDHLEKLVLGWDFGGLILLLLIGFFNGHQRCFQVNGNCLNQKKLSWKEPQLIRFIRFLLVFRIFLPALETSRPPKSIKEALKSATRLDAFQSVYVSIGGPLVTCLEATVF